jgi:hypothetical protein
MDDDVLVYMAGEGLVRVMKPEETDSPALKATKMFLLACLHRRNIDDTFDDNMAVWLTNSIQQIKEQSAPLRH